LARSTSQAETLLLSFICVFIAEVTPCLYRPDKRGVKGFFHQDGAMFIYRSRIVLRVPVPVRSIIGGHDKFTFIKPLMNLAFPLLPTTHSNNSFRSLAMSSESSPPLSTSGTPSPSPPSRRRHPTYNPHRSLVLSAYSPNPSLTPPILPFVRNSGHFSCSSSLLLAVRDLP